MRKAYNEYEKAKKEEDNGQKKPKQNTAGSATFEFPSMQSMEGIFAGVGLGGRQSNAVIEAQQLMYDAWEAPTRQRAVALAKKALSISPDCADAYSFLAEQTAKSVEEAIDLYAKGVEAGERAIGKQAFAEDVGHFWGLLETRPYMRARAGLAECLWAIGRQEEAVAHFQDLLRLNPNDNQGVRDLLMPRLIELGRDKDAEKLFRQFDDGMATWMYSRALLDFRKLVASPKAGASLKAALTENKFVPSYLLGRKKMPRNLPDHFGFGDDAEAVIYAYGNKAAWQSTAGALEWLAGKLK
jgi:tetratricopeptide (TPR) repeat protein